jgi:hypothetical protein
MLERSGESDYSDLAQKVAKATTAGYEAGAGSPPSLIAAVIAKAITARRPKTRYVAGKYARPVIALRRLVSDRTFDRLMMSRI